MAIPFDTVMIGATKGKEPGKVAQNTCSIQQVKGKQVIVSWLGMDEASWMTHSVTRNVGVRFANIWSTLCSNSPAVSELIQNSHSQCKIAKNSTIYNPWYPRKTQKT